MFAKLFFARVTYFLDHKLKNYFIISAIHPLIGEGEKIETVRPLPKSGGE
jgi:hypothetical protein